MSVRLPLLVLLLSSIAIPPARADAIREVTVYRDRAEVIREKRVEVPAGSTALRFDGIPLGVEADSLRVSAQGTPAVFGAVEIVDEAEEPVETEEFLAARDEVRSLERGIRELDAQAKVGDELGEFLASLRAAVAESQSRELGQGRADPQAIGALYELLEQRLGALATGHLDRVDRRRDLQERLEVARARLAVLRPAGKIRSRSAVVEVQTERAGPLLLRLAYVVPGASWRPSYRASLDADGGDVSLVVEAVVRQNRGEDWTGVALTLSSAAPAQGVEPPFLRPWVLAPARPAGPAVSQRREAKTDAGFYQNVVQLAPGVAEGAAAEPATTAQAALLRSAYNVSFRVPGSSDVPADGRDHRVSLRSETLAGNVVHRTVPGLDARAYLTSVTTTPADYPLLAGPVRVYAEGAYLGSFHLEEKGPGAELTVPFGVDNRLEVVRVPMPRSAGRQGFGGKQREVEFDYRTRLHNLQDRPVKLVLEERLPVAEDERIDVRLSEATTGGFEDSVRRPGVKIWTLDLAAGEELEVVFAYSVRYPRELALPGIEP